MDTLESLRLASRLRLREGDTVTVGQQPAQPQAQQQGAATQSQADLVKAFQQALEGVQQNIMDHVDSSLEEFGKSLLERLKGSNGSKNSNDEQSEQSAGSKSGMSNGSDSNSNNSNMNGGNNNGN